MIALQLHRVHHRFDMGGGVRKHVLRVSDTNQAGQPQKMARGLKFWIKEEEGL